MHRQPKTKRRAASTQTLQTTPKWLRGLVLGLSLLLMLCWLSRKTADADTWWHLKTGQFILTQHRLPLPDPFAWTTYLGKPVYTGEEITRDFNLTHEWLAQVALYGMYAGGGLSGLVLMRAAFLIGFCALAGLMAYRRTASFYRALSATAMCAVVMNSFPEDGPQYFTYVFLALSINLLDSGRLVWLLPPLFLIWANFHGGFILGWVAVGIYLTESFYYRWRGRPAKNERTLWLAGLGAMLVSGVNPNGFRAFEIVWNYGRSPLQSQIIEWYRPKFWELSPFTVLLYGGLLVLLLNRRKARPAEWLLFAAFALAGLLAWRNVVFTAWVGAFLIAAYVPVWSQFPKRKALEFGLAVILLAAVTIVIGQGQALRFRNAIETPAAAASDFLLQNNVQGRLFNTYSEGGYLIWRLGPKLQVFADGRALNESIAQDMQRIVLAADASGSRSGEDLLRDYGVDVIVMSAFEPVSGQAYYLPVAFADPQQTEWKLVYYDSHELIYMRHAPPGVQLPDQLDGLVAMEEECTAWINSGAPACTQGMIDVFTRIGDADRAYKWSGIRRRLFVE